MILKCFTFILKYISGINDIGKQDCRNDRDQVCNIQFHSAFSKYKEADQIHKGRTSSKEHIADHIILIKVQDQRF